MPLEFRLNSSVDGQCYLSVEREAKEKAECEVKERAE